MKTKQYKKIVLCNDPRCNKTISNLYKNNWHLLDVYKNKDRISIAVFEKIGEDNAQSR